MSFVTPCASCFFLPDRALFHDVVEEFHRVGQQAGYGPVGEAGHFVLCGFGGPLGGFQHAFAMAAEGRILQGILGVLEPFGPLGFDEVPHRVQLGCAQTFYLVLPVARQ